MEPSSRDRISVDLHGLKPALMEHAQALGVSPPELVRKTLAEELGQSAGKVNDPSEKRDQKRAKSLVRARQKILKPPINASFQRLPQHNRRHPTSVHASRGARNISA